MAQLAFDDNQQFALRLKPAERAIIMRAAALARTDINDFILRTVLQEAQAVIDGHQRLKLSRRDTQLVMKLLENPRPANAKLRKAARAMPDQK